MDVLTVVAFILPLIPLLHAAKQDWKTKEFDSALILCVAVFGLTCHAIFWPNVILNSIAFGLFALSLGLFIAEFKGLTLGDAFMMGAIGIAVMPVDYFKFIYLSIIVFAIFGIMSYLMKKTRKELDGIFSILVIFVIYSISVV